MLPELTEIKARRKSAGLTQSQLAELANISQSLIAKVESKQLIPSYDNAKRIFDALERLHRESDVKARDIMTKKVVAAARTDSVKKAVQLMEKKALSQLPVLAEGKSIGTISEKSVLAKLGEGHAVNPAKVKVEEVMEESLPLIQENMPLSIVSQMLRYSPALLVAKKGKISGIIAKADLLKAMVK